MSLLADVLPRPAQLAVLACLDSHGIVADADRLVDVLAEHLPDFVLNRVSGRFADFAYELWLGSHSLEEPQKIL